MKKNHLLVSLLLITSNMLFAQESSLKKEKEIIITVGPTATKLLNTNIDKDESKNVDKQIGVNFNLSYNRYFKNRIGFGIGIGFSDYKQTVYQKGLFEKVNQTDIDNNIYDSWVSADMKYTSNLKYIDVPIMLHLLLGKSKTFFGFIDAGIINGFLIDGKYTKKGSVENMGVYYGNPYWSDLSQNNPYYGHKKESVDKEYKENYKFYNASFRASFGIAASLTERVFLRIAPEITKGFSDITNKDDKGKDYENVFGDKSAYKPTKTFSLGLNVGFSFNL